MPKDSQNIWDELKSTVVCRVMNEFVESVECQIRAVTSTDENFTTAPHYSLTADRYIDGQHARLSPNCRDTGQDL